jgi:hypothetical protein
MSDSSSEVMTICAPDRFTNGGVAINQRSKEDLGFYGGEVRSIFEVEIGF